MDRECLGKAEGTTTWRSCCGFHLSFKLVCISLTVKFYPILAHCRKRTSVDRKSPSSFYRKHVIENSDVHQVGYIAWNVSDRMPGQKSHRQTLSQTLRHSLSCHSSNTIWHTLPYYGMPYHAVTYQVILCHTILRVCIVRFFRYGTDCRTVTESGSGINYANHSLRSPCFVCP